MPVYSRMIFQVHGDKINLIRKGIPTFLVPAIRGDTIHTWGLQIMVWQHLFQ